MVDAAGLAFASVAQVKRRNADGQESCVVWAGPSADAQVGTVASLVSDVLAAVEISKARTRSDTEIFFRIGHIAHHFVDELSGVCRPETSGIRAFGRS